MSAIVTLGIGFIWFGSGFLASCLLKGAMREVFPKTGEKYGFVNYKQCQTFFWMGVFGLILVQGVYRELNKRLAGMGVNLRRPYFCLNMPKELCDTGR
jgi:hypothetical protein